MTKEKSHFARDVLTVVAGIPEGTVLTYGEVAELAGHTGSARAVGTVMKENRNPEIPCFRVVRGDGRPGAYNRGVEKKQRLLRKEGSLGADGRVRRYVSRGEYISRAQMIAILKNGGIGVIPTDTIYGIVCRAEDHKTVWRVYKARERNIAKPCIVLLADPNDVVRFGVRLRGVQRNIVRAVWPGPVSIVLPCIGREFSYLTRGTDTIAFRVPDDEDVRALLRETGPIIAPSANFEGKPSCETAEEAMEIFGDAVDVYAMGPRLRGKWSTLIALEKDDIVLRREGRMPFSHIQKKLSVFK